MADIEPSRPEYRQVADLLRQAITAGEFPPGSALPGEPDLAARFGVTRSTVNRALALLRAEGLVRPERGRGTTVAPALKIRRNAVARYQRTTRERADGRGAFDSEIKALGLTPRSDLTVERRTSPPAVAEILGVAPDVPVLVRARRMFAGDEPVQLADSYIPLDVAEGTALENRDSGPGGIISRFADLGLTQVRITEQVDVRPATSQEATFLALSADQRVYVITHTGWTADDRAVEVCIHVMPTHMWELHYEWGTDPV